MAASSSALPESPKPDAVQDAQARSLTFGVSGLYLALYLHFGYFAFIPLWLKSTGAAAGEIGILLAIPLILRLVTVAPFVALAGRHGQVRNAIIATAVLSAALILLLLGKPDHAGRIVIVLLFSVAWDQIPVLADAYAVMAVRSHGLDFGRVRVWGSIAVVISTGTAGWVIGQTGISALPLMVAALLLLPAIVAPFMPSDRSMAAVEKSAHGRWRDVISDRQLMRALIAAALIMGSHGVITNFGAIQWSAKGISTTMIGILQAIAVGVEIIAFTLGRKFLGERDPILLVWIASGAAMIRWIIMALDPGLAVTSAAQLLHGISSTGAILGVMMVIAKRVPVETSAAAQGVNAVLLGVALAVVTAGSGLLWAAGIAVSYAAMAALAALGMIVAWPRADSR